MLTLNKTLITGRLTRDPETKYLPSGQAVTQFAIAHNRNFKDKDGNWKSEPTFLDVKCWGKTAEAVAERFQKGANVFVEGQIKQESWERDGQKHSKLVINADVVKAMDRKGDADGEDVPAPAPAAAKGNRGEYRQKPGPQASDDLDFSAPGTEDDIPF